MGSLKMPATIEEFVKLNKEHLLFVKCDNAMQAKEASEILCSIYEVNQYEDYFMKNKLYSEHMCPAACCGGIIKGHTDTAYLGGNSTIYPTDWFVTYEHLAKIWYEHSAKYVAGLDDLKVKFLI